MGKGEKGMIYIVKDLLNKSGNCVYYKETVQVTMGGNLREYDAFTTQISNAMIFESQEEAQVVAERIKGEVIPMDKGGKR